MSVRAALDALKMRLETMSTPTPRRIYADPAEAVSLADFPAIVLSLAPGELHTWSRKAIGLGLHQYRVAIWVFVGTLNTPLPQLHSAVLDWPEPIADALLADQRLDNAVAFTGDGGAVGELFRYEIGAFEWGGGQYFGLRVILPVAETKAQPMN